MEQIRQRRAEAVLAAEVAASARPFEAGLDTSAETVVTEETTLSSSNSTNNNSSSESEDERVYSASIWRKKMIFKNP